jgi:hypothetical protein
MKFDDAKPKVGQDSVRLDDLIDIFKFPKNQFVSFRFLDKDIMPMKTHWINILAGKDKREVNIPKLCVSFDPETESHKKGVECPYCDLAGKRDDFKYLVNAIVREEQEDKPKKAKDPSKSEAKSGFKDANSDSWTPVRVLRLPSSLFKKIQDLKLNKKKNKDTDKTETYSISHSKFGCDIAIKFNPDAKGGDMYQVQLQDRTPLSEEEKEFLSFKLEESLLDACGREDTAQAEKELAKMDIVGQEKIEEDEKSTKSKKSKKPSEDDDDEDDLDLDDDEEDEKPKKKKKKAVDDDEDDEPVKRKKKKASDEDDEDEDEKPKKKKKVVANDDDDDPEDDEEEEKPAKGKKSKKVVEDDDDEEDEKLKKKKKKVVDEDEDDDLDDDEPF